MAGTDSCVVFTKAVFTSSLAFVKCMSIACCRQPGEIVDPDFVSSRGHVQIKISRRPSARVMTTASAAFPGYPEHLPPSTSHIHTPFRLIDTTSGHSRRAIVPDFLPSSSRFPSHRATSLVSCNCSSAHQTPHTQTHTHSDTHTPRADSRIPACPPPAHPYFPSPKKLDSALPFFSVLFRKPHHTPPPASLTQASDRPRQSRRHQAPNPLYCIRSVKSSPPKDLKDLSRACACASLRYCRTA